MPNKTIYVSAKDEALFDEAQKIGDDALSAVIVRALQEFVSRNRDRQENMEEISVLVGTTGAEREQRFIGQEVAKWQGTSDDKEWWMEAVIYRTHKSNWAVWLSTVAKAELLVRGAKNWLDWANNPRRSELIVSAQPSELKSKVPSALFSLIGDVSARDELEAEYLDI
jgi:EXLDI family protein